MIFRLCRLIRTGECKLPTPSSRERLAHPLQTRSRFSEDMKMMTSSGWDGPIANIDTVISAHCSLKMVTELWQNLYFDFSGLTNVDITKTWSTITRKPWLSGESFKKVRSSDDIWTTLQGGLDSVVLLLSVSEKVLNFFKYRLNKKRPMCQNLKNKVILA